MKTVTVAEWGAGEHESIPHRLSAFIEKLSQAQQTIPLDYRGNAEVDCEPHYEFGESYARVRVVYERPLTIAERRIEAIEQRAHWDNQYQNAVDRQAYCLKQIAEISP